MLQQFLFIYIPNISHSSEEVGLLQFLLQHVGQFFGGVGHRTKVNRNNGSGFDGGPLLHLINTIY